MKSRNLNHSDNYKTPDYILNPLNEEFHFDFDPCPYCEGTLEFDGLIESWGHSNWVNPPYSRKLKEAFVRKALEESKLGKICVMLLPVSTSTKLFHEVILPNAKDIRFVKGRIRFEVLYEGKFIETRSNGMHDSMIVVFDGRIY